MEREKSKSQCVRAGFYAVFECTSVIDCLLLHNVRACLSVCMFEHFMCVLCV